MPKKWPLYIAGGALIFGLGWGAANLDKMGESFARMSRDAPRVAYVEDKKYIKFDIGADGKDEFIDFLGVVYHSNFDGKMYKDEETTKEVSSAFSEIFQACHQSDKAALENARSRYAADIFDVAFTNVLNLHDFAQFKKQKFPFDEIVSIDINNKELLEALFQHLKSVKDVRDRNLQDRIRQQSVQMSYYNRDDVIVTRNGKKYTIISVDRGAEKPYYAYRTVGDNLEYVNLTHEEIAGRDRDYSDRRFQGYPMGNLTPEEQQTREEQLNTVPENRIKERWAQEEQQKKQEQYNEQQRQQLMERGRILVEPAKKAEEFLRRVLPPPKQTQPQKRPPR